MQTGEEGREGRGKEGEEKGVRLEETGKSQQLEGKMPYVNTEVGVD